MRDFARAALVAAALIVGPLAVAVAVAQNDDGPPIPAARGLVNDVAGVMDEQSVARLEAFLDQVKEKTGAELAVLTMKSTAPASPSDYKVRVFNAWKIGRGGEDDGLLLLVAIEEREARFETGYGLEGTLPDGLQSRIFRRTMQPRFREGDYAGGISAGMIECARRIAAERGVTLSWNGEELRYSGRTGKRMPLWAVLLIFLVLAVAMGAIGGGSGFSGPRGGRGMWAGRPRRHGGWGGGFGGAGRGGRSFGGFGGGMSGGGGGGGSW